MPKSERPLPANQHSERVVLGELLLNNAAWSQAKALTEDDFSLSSHRRIFACIRSRLSRGRPIDTILLIDAMRKAKELDSMGVAYICDLTTDTTEYIGEHVILLREKARLRWLLETAHNLSEWAYSEEDSGAMMVMLTGCLSEIPEPLESA